MGSALNQLVQDLGIEKRVSEIAESGGTGLTASELAAQIHEPFANEKAQAKVQTTFQKTTKTAQDMQKKKEDALEEQNPVNSEEIKKERTAKEYEEYTKSEEYKKNLEEKAAEEAKPKSFVELIAEITNPNKDIAQPKIIQDDKEQRLKAVKDKAEAEYNASEDQKVIVSDLETISQMSPEERKALEEYTVNRDVDYFKTLSSIDQNGVKIGRAEEKAADLIAKYGENRVDELANSLSRIKNEGLTQQAAEAGQKHGNEHWLLSSAGSVGANLVGGVTGTMDYFKELGRNDTRFKTLDPNAMGNLASTYAGAVRGQVQKNIEGEDPNLARKLVSLGYQGLMSAADSGARAAVGGGTGGAILAGAGTFSQTMADASARGATPGQAVALATASSAIEALSEKIPLDELVKTAKGGKQTAKQIIGTALKQAGIEATTEEISLIGTMLADVAILKEKSSYKQDIINGIMRGLSPAQAAAEANRKVMEEAKNTALVSMLSGGMSSAGGSVLANYRATEADTTPNIGKPEDIKKQALAKVRGTEEQQTTPAAEIAKPAEQTATVAENATADKTEAITEAEEEYDEDIDIDEEPEEVKAIADALRSSGKKKSFNYEGYKVSKYTGGSYKGEPYFSYRITAPNGDVIKGETAYYNDSFFSSVAQEIDNHRKVNTQPTQEQQATNGTDAGNVDNLWGKRDGENGWSDMAGGNSVWATALAMKEVNPEYFAAYMKAAEGEHTTPVIDAVINAANDVRQESISPMAAATVINEIYTKQGEAGLRTLYNPKNGNLYDSVLNRMKAVDSKKQAVGIDLDEDGRYAEISKKRVIVTNDTESAKVPEEITKIENEPGKAKSKVEGAIKAIASKLGLTQKKHTSPSVEVEFTFSKNKGLKESMSKQLKYGGSYADFAKAIANIDHILDNAVMIEKHTDKYKGTVREDRHLESTSVLMSLFRDRTHIIPVQFEIKKSSQNGGQLYVTVAMTKIEADVVGRTVDKNQASSLVSASDYSISEIIAKINPEDKHFLKYVPDKMLTEQQKQAKQEALEEDFERISGYERTDGKTREEVRKQFDKYGLRHSDEQKVKGTGAAEQNFSGKAEYQNLLSEDNVQRDRPGDVRPMEVPKTDSFGRRVSELVGNAFGAEITTDKMANTIEELVQEGALGFDVRHNQDSINKAAEQIEQRGVAATRKQITNAVANGKIRDGDVEQAILLYAMYNSKNTPTAIDNASEILVDLATMANITGRNLQMFRLLRKMTPEGQVSTIKKTVQNNVESMIRSGSVKKGYTTEIDPEMLAEYRKAANENMRAVSEEQKKASAEKMKTIMDAIYSMEAAKMPATMKAKWDAWRYMAMLGNVKTQARNVAGNALFVPYKEVKDRAAALGEKLFLVPKEKRTKTLFTDPELLKWAREDRKSQFVNEALKYSAKLGDDLTDQKFREQAKVFNSKALESTRKLIEKVPQAGDMLFKNGYYARSLADFMRARGYKASDIQNGIVSDEILNEARSYAIQEAMKATFNDANVVSDFFSTEMRYKGENPVGKLVNTAMEGVMPFRRTPANIAVRFEEYSPLGIVNTIWKAVDPLKTGKYTASDVIDSLASSLTGTAVMGLGYFLAKGIAGVKLTGSDLSEDEERQGHQKYAIEFSDKDGNEYSYKIDWAAPANLPLFVGANIFDTLENNGEDTDISKFTAFVRGLGNAFEPMLALSCLSGINDIFESARYAGEGEALYTGASNIATGYLSQGIPALLRQAAQATQEVKRSAFSESNDPTIRDVESTLSGIPFYGDKFKTDKLNAWGEKETQSEATAEVLGINNKAARAFDAFFNPGTLKKIDTSALEQEITRLNKAQEESVSPSYIPKVISYTDKEGTLHKDHRLTEEEYQKLAQTQGQTARAILEKMINTTAYKGMDDSMKAKAMQMAYSYARQKAMAETFDTSYDSNWMIGITQQTAANKIVMEVADNALNSALSNIKTARKNNYSAENLQAYEKDLDKAYAAYAKMPAAQKKTIMDSATGDTKKFLEVKSKGVTTQQYLSATKAISNLRPETGYSEVRDIQTREAIAKLPGVSESAIDILMKAYMPDYDPNAKTVQKTELKYDYARQELDLSPKEYTSVYRVSLDGGKKAEKIADWMEMGYTRQEATMFYRLFDATGVTKIDVEKWYNSK